MAISVSDAGLPWWKEPTKDQWYAFGAAWLGWVLDAFDFTVFLLIMVPIAKEFDVPLTDVAIVFTNGAPVNCTMIIVARRRRGV
jgi:MFS transporter, SHS family, lactate transporter